MLFIYAWLKDLGCPEAKIKFIEKALREVVDMSYAHDYNNLGCTLTFSVHHDLKRIKHRMTIDSGWFFLEQQLEEGKDPFTVIKMNLDWIN